jgi:hypothetical protein
MVQPTQPRNRDYGRTRLWLWLDSPSVRRILFQRIVKAIFLMVVHIIAHDPAQMLLVQCDDVVKDLAPATSDPALGNAIGEGRQLHRIVSLRIQPSK